MPNIAFLTIALGLGAFVCMLQNDLAEAAIVVQPVIVKPELPEPTSDLSWNDMETIDVIGLEAGYRLIPLADKNRGGQLMNRIGGVRRKLSQDLGLLIQPVHIRDNLDLPPGRYRITILGVPEGEGVIHSDKELAINAGNVFGDIDGISTRDPSFGMEAK